MRHCDRIALLLMAALFASSCNASSPPSDAAIDVDETTRLEIGTGFTAYETLPEDAPTLEIVHGPQGGYHVYLSMRVTGLVPASLLWRVVRQDDGRVLANLDLLARTGTFRPVDGALERVGDLVVIDVLSPADVAMRDVRVEASATSSTGAMTTSVCVLRIVDDVP